ncbi:hypothetical protein AVEN_239609-1 [Araneus ventricosus]|uniref:Uncharacterized protein n=1 Tax=Araneus ventricosus TaxID=182803 RepID=A0A4Y2PKQ5_ARAVE|nr:hypothetical protein AVEN_243318-1 [Araneus ventricosus]GBN51712.1 hypothetical protein AVEN_239609-1 [Araneus ventricosus]
MTKTTPPQCRGGPVSDTFLYRSVIIRLPYRRKASVEKLPPTWHRLDGTKFLESIRLDVFFELQPVFSKELN